MRTATDYRGGTARYEAVRERLRMLPRQPLEILDFGTHNGFVAYGLAADLGAHVTAIDANEQPPEDNELVRWVRRRVEVEEIEDLGRFDVVLALSVLHHFADWRRALEAFRRIARMLVVVEVPHPDERLNITAARHELPSLYRHVTERRSGPGIALASATHQSELMRETVAVTPLLRGRVFGGSGSHRRTQEAYGYLFEGSIGWRPYPGSLNLRLPSRLDIGPPQRSFNIGGTSRLYHFWDGMLSDGIRAPRSVVLMDPVGGLTHPNSIEVLAPVCLRDEFELSDGDEGDVGVVW